MGDWKKWTLTEWNRRLLEHYFRATDERSTPVTALLVTAEELARCTGDPGADAEDARDAFVSILNDAVRQTQRKDLIEHASEYPGWPERPPLQDAVPRFVAHLIFTCVAASESSAALGNEAQFVTRLRELSCDQLPANSLRHLPQLWEHLAAWLGANSGKYRLLTLPDPGGLTRIGYTVKLAFPDRRDQLKLAGLLAEDGLAGHEPPVGRTLSLISKNRDEFRESFLAEFDDFRRRVQSADSGTTWQLAVHRFWAAVRDAALRGRTALNGVDPSHRVGCLADEDDGQLLLFLTAEGIDERLPFQFRPFTTAYGSWSHALVEAHGAQMGNDQLASAVASVLDGRNRLPGVSNLVDQGLLPFAPAPHGLLELIGSHDQLSEATVVLVRESLADSFFRLIGDRTWRTSNYAGWIQVDQPRLTAQTSEAVEKTGLEKVWILQKSLTPMTCRLVDGVWVDDGWLGVSEVLPKVIAPGASSVALDGPDGVVALTRADDGRWLLPAVDRVGEHWLVVEISGAKRRQALRFHSAPANEQFKEPSDPAAWITEAIGGTGTLSDESGFCAHPQDEDLGAYCDRVTLLGPDVGEFVSDPARAAWRLCSFGGNLVGTLAARCGDDVIPKHQVTNDRARRYWRKLLARSVAHASDTKFYEARSRARRAADNHDLPRLEVEQDLPDFIPMRFPEPRASVGRFVRVIAGRAAARKGLDWIEWSTLTQRILEIDLRSLEHVTRAYAEAGFIDVASSAQWRRKRVFARSPHLVAFRAGPGYGATLCGLTLPATRAALSSAASELGVLVEVRRSVSPVVPSTLAFRAPNLLTLQRLATVSGLSLRWVDLNSLNTFPLQHHAGSPPPGQYERPTRWHNWSLAGGEQSAVLVQRHVHHRRPGFWTASSAGRSVWSYELNVVRLWAATLVAEAPVAPAGEGFLVARHAFLPLPLARVVAVLGAALSGPGEGGYTYVPGTLMLRNWVLERVVAAHDLSRLSVGETH